MVQITTFALAAVALASQAAAITCTPGVYYCGWYLTSGSDRNEWLTKINNALVASNRPTTDTYRFDSLFTCGVGNSIVWDDHCKTAPNQNLNCVAPQNTVCGGTNYCCAP